MKNKLTQKKPKTIFSKIFQKTKKILNEIQKLFSQLSSIIFAIGEKNRRLFEIFQLTIIYFLAIFQLLITCLTFSGSVGEIYKILPFFHELVYSPFGFFFSNPDRTYIFYLLAQEFIVLRPHILKFSLIVRYNILYIMTLEFLFNCIINWWDILCNFENDSIFEAKVDRSFAAEFFLILFAIYFCVYIYSYIRAVTKRLPVFPNPLLQKIPDSVAFWLQIKKEAPEQKG